MAESPELKKRLLFLQFTFFGSCFFVFVFLFFNLFIVGLSGFLAAEN